jgi:hypothetical protein
VNGYVEGTLSPRGTPTQTQPGRWKERRVTGVIRDGQTGTSAECALDGKLTRLVQLSPSQQSVTLPD